MSGSRRNAGWGRAGGRRGVASVELAAFLPLLMLLCLGACDYGRAFYASVVLNNCARNGALYAACPSLAAQTPYANTTAAAQANAANLGATNVGVTTASGTDSYGNSYVEVTTSYTFNTIVNYLVFPGSIPLSSKVRMMVAPS